MKISFLEGIPALFLDKYKTIVAGDLHIGLEFKFNKLGIHFTNASDKMALKLLEICKKYKAEKLVLLGDIKDSIAYPPYDELDALKNFFKILNNIEIEITKGNHDGHLNEILKEFQKNVIIKKEILFEDVAFLHGNALPSQEAMKKNLIIIGHGHVALYKNDKYEKAWVISKLGKNAKLYYKNYNKKIKLIVFPAFNDLIIGTNFNSDSKTNMPLFRRDIFSLKSAKTYDLYSKT